MTAIDPGLSRRYQFRQQHFLVSRIIAAVIFLVSCGRVIAGDYLVIFKQHVSENATPSVLECDSLEVYPGYSKLITKGGPTFEVKSGALIATVAKKDFFQLDGYSREYPALKNTLGEVKSRWQSEVGAATQRKLEAERAFSESVSDGSRIRALDGHVYRGIIQASGQYSLAVTTTEGVTSVGIAQLCTGDLKKWNTVGRDHDGRFWYERSLAIIRAKESGADVSAESAEAEAHFPEAKSYLAQMDSARDQRRKVMNEKFSAPRNGLTGPGNQLKTQEDIDEMLRMSRLGYTPVLDESTGQVFYSAPVGREQQLRNAIQGKPGPED